MMDEGRGLTDRRVQQAARPDSRSGPDGCWHANGGNRVIRGRGRRRGGRPSARCARRPGSTRARSSARPGPPSGSPGRRVSSSTGAPAAASWLILVVLSGTLDSLEVLLADREITPILRFARIPGCCRGPGVALARPEPGLPQDCPPPAGRARTPLPWRPVAADRLAGDRRPARRRGDPLPGHLRIGGGLARARRRRRRWPRSSSLLPCGRTFALLAENASDWLIVAAASLAVVVGWYATFLARDRPARPVSLPHHRPGRWASCESHRRHGN